MKKFVWTVLLLLPQFSLFAQAYLAEDLIMMKFPQENTNARIGGMAGIGVVASPFYRGANAYQNCALFPDTSVNMGANLSYYMLGRLNTGISYLGDLSIYANYHRHAWGYNLSVQDGGRVQILNPNGQLIDEYHVFRAAHKLHYAYQLNPHFSMGLAGKFIHLREIYFASPQNFSTYQIVAPAMDIGFQYQNKKSMETYDSYLHYQIGAAITNFGGQVSYINYYASLPTQLLLGGMISQDYFLTPENRITFDFSYQLEKYLTSSVVLAPDSNRLKIPLQSLYQSFYDSPAGFKGEMNEFRHKLGVEGRIQLKPNFHIAARLGYNYQPQPKISSIMVARYKTAGFSLLYQRFAVHISYFRARRGLTQNNSNWAFSFQYNFG